MAGEQTAIFKSHIELKEEEQMSEKKVRVVRSSELSKPYEPRYIVVDFNTGAILEDAQGYGYKTPRKAHAAWGYKNRTPAQKAAQESAKKTVRKWAKEHRDFMDDMEDLAFRIAKGSCGPEEFDAKTVAKCLKKWGFTDLPFTAAELLKYGM